MNIIKEKYKIWGIAILIAIICIFIGNFFGNLFSESDPIQQTVITVNAPENMHKAFTNTLKNLKINKEYRIEFTNDAYANFVVTEGQKAEGELIAYSPFVAVFNDNEDFYNQMINDEIFVASDINSDYYDFDFKKIINQILSPSGSNFKVYYPSRNSDCWDEFYNFLLITVNDGFYPKEGSNMEEAKKVVEAFLNSKNAEAISKDGLEKINSFSLNAIYFATYVDLAEIYDSHAFSDYLIMYPKAVVYHNYYANFDKTGKMLFDFMHSHGKGILGSDHTGFVELSSYKYNTKYVGQLTSIDGQRYERNQYNVVEIPNVTENNVINKEDN